MSRALRVLVADDESRLRELLVRELGRKGHEVEGVGDGEAALARLRERAYYVVILDMKMPRKEGIEVLRELGAFPEHPQVIVMTGFQEVATAVEAMKLGAYDYLTKPTKIEELDIVVRKAAEKGQLLRDNQALRAHAPGAAPFSGIHTKSPRMHEVLRVVERVAPTDSSVLVLGESGTGKELVARAIHERAARPEPPFVPIHCGALPRDVLESELFGHEKGAFTGALASKPGLIELAVIRSRRDEIQPDDLPPEVLGAAAPPPAPGVAGGSLETMERQHIVATLRQVAGHRGKAAALLAIDPKTLYRKINGYQIRPEEFR